MLNWVVSRAGIEPATLGPGDVLGAGQRGTRRAALETKTGPRVLPLPAAVVNLLAGLPRINGNPWVFAGAKRGTAVGYMLTRDVFAKEVKAAGLVDAA